MPTQITNVALVAVASLAVGSAATAMQIIMDETTNNGFFSENADSGAAPNRGSWTSDVSRAAGWNALPDSVASFPWTQNGGASEGTLLGYFDDVVINNTGTSFGAGSVFSISALGNTTQPGLGINVEVVATENSDGTGASLTLATATLSGGTADPNTYPFPANTNPSLVTFSGTGAPAPGSVDGYFVQVRVSSDQNAFGYFYVDNIVVTVPEPASAMLIGAGALTVFGRRRRSA